MADVTIFHNPNCSTSRFAVETAAEMGVDVDLVKYMLKAQHPSRETLEHLVAILDGPASDLVRRDNNFARLGLDEADIQSGPEVVNVLVEHPELLQRPILVRGDTAIIGRPKDKVRPFLS